MAAKRKDKKSEAAQADAKEKTKTSAQEKAQKTKTTKGVRVTNNATVALPIMDVRLKPGRSAFFNNFDETTKIHAAWIKARMISVS